MISLRKVVYEPIQDAPELMSLSDASAMLGGVALPTIFAAIERGTIRGYKDDSIAQNQGQTKVAREDVQAWLDRRAKKKGNE